MVSNWVSLPITKDTDKTVNQSELESQVADAKRGKMHANASQVVLVCTSDWMKKGREFFKPIAWRRKCKTNYFSTLK